MKPFMLLAYTIERRGLPDILDRLRATTGTRGVQVAVNSIPCLDFFRKTVGRLSAREVARFLHAKRSSFARSTAHWIESMRPVTPMRVYSPPFIAVDLRSQLLPRPQRGEPFRS